ncbi:MULTISPECIES: M48 family metalloprotease [Chryseobacterium]|nr:MULTISPECIES: M48 family metalloprotease [Chryseobacterium]
MIKLRNKDINTLSALMNMVINNELLAVISHEIWHIKIR